MQILRYEANRQHFELYDEVVSIGELILLRIK